MVYRFCLLPALLAGCTSLHTGPGQFRADFLPFYGEVSDSTGVDEVIPVGLFRYTRDENTGEDTYRFLWPMGLYRARGQESFLQIFPIFYHKNQLDPNGLPESVGFVFPLVFWGDSADEGSYLGSFFWGHLKGQFGKDDLYFRAAPIYMHFRDKGFFSTHVLFPFVNWVWGDGNSGWRVFPFYGRYRKSDPEGNAVFDRQFALWPFFIHNRNNLNARYPSETFFLFPFYGSITSATHNDHTVLWPLFRWVEDKLEGGRQWELRAPFPILRISRGPKEEKTIVWPLFGMKVTPNRFMQFALFPIQRYERIDSERVEETRFWFIPVFWSYHYRYKTGANAGKSRREMKIWPLFKYREDVEGSVSLSLLSPLWFKDPEGFDAIWDPLFRVYYKENRADGSVLTRVLWGAYSSLVDRRGESATIWPLFTSWGATVERRSWLTILGGLYEHVQSGGRDAYRFLYIPFGDEIEEDGEEEGE